MKRSLIVAVLLICATGAQAQPYAPDGYPPPGPGPGPGPGYGYAPPPPPLRFEPPPPPPPAPGYFWVGGRWG